MKRVRVGGFRQRIAADDAAAPAAKRFAKAPPPGPPALPVPAAAANASPGSALASLLLTSWAWGQISTPMVQRIASAAVEDGLDLPEVKKLAKLGIDIYIYIYIYRKLTVHLGF